MRPFDLLQPTSLDEAVGLAARYGDDARWIGGGAMLMPLLRERIVQPTTVISTVDIPELTAWSAGGGGVHAGAATTLRTMERSRAILDNYPVLAEALSVIGNIRVRNVATVGGHLAQADPHMDLPPVLVALGAIVTVAGPNGERTLPLDELLVDYYETSLEPGEIIVGLDLPPMPNGLAGAYLKFCALSPNDWPTVGVAAFIRPEDGRVRDARVVAGCVADSPLRVTEAEDLLRGEAITAHAIAEVARRYAAAAKPLDDFRGSADYKRTVTEVYVRRALESAAARAGMSPN